jgi:dTDP-4-dehydrorhamnose reductase
MSKKVLILGATGMLGHTCLSYFNSDSEFDTYGTWRKDTKENLKAFDVLKDSIEDLIQEIQPNWVINCIGMIKQRIDESNQFSVMSTRKINQMFPRDLANAVAGTDARVIQIATDCVFSGEKGRYCESSPHNAIDLYGRSKSLGEILAPEFINLRTSIIGRELSTNFSLVDWFLSHDLNSEVNGYLNHYWNGITTSSFARIAHGIIKSDGFISGTFHVVPSNEVSKYELLQLIRESYEREDLLIRPVEAPRFVDRTLHTNHPNFNEAVWSSAGYESIPSIEELVDELANNT